MRTLSSTEWVDRLALKVLVVNTLDLLPHVDYDVAKVRRQALVISPDLDLRSFEPRCRTGEGLGGWCA